MIATVTLNPSLDEWMRLPSLAVGKLNRAGDFVRYPGGKGINVSRVAHELGEPTIAYGLAGGADGRMLRGLMRQMDIRHVFVDVNGNTRNNYKILTETPRGLTEINTAGPRVTASELSLLKRLALGQKPAQFADPEFPNPRPSPNPRPRHTGRGRQHPKQPSSCETSIDAEIVGNLGACWTDRRHNRTRWPKGISNTG